MFNKFTGSFNIGQNIPKSDEFVTMGYMLDAVNASEITWAREDMMFIMPYVDVINGQNGQYQLFESMSVLFQDDSAYLDPEAFEKEVASWTFQRRAYSVRNISFDSETYETMYERYGADRAMNGMFDTALKALATAIDTYRNIYLPNVLFEKLLKVPTAGGAFYEKKGFARNTPVNKTAIKKVTSTVDGAKGSLVRNHFRTIADGAGLTLADVNFYKGYMAEYNRINKNNLVFMGGDAELTALKALYPQYSPEAWEVVRNGIKLGLQGEKIAGIKMVNVDWTPDNKLFLMNSGASAIITNLKSDNAEFQGISIDVDDVQERYTDVRLLEGSKIKINAEGYAVTGRLDGMWIDIDTDNASTDRIMKAEGIAELNDASEGTRAQWYRGVTDAK